MGGRGAWFAPSVRADEVSEGLRGSRVECGTGGGPVHTTAREGEVDGEDASTCRRGRRGGGAMLLRVGGGGGAEGRSCLQHG